MKDNLFLEDINGIKFFTSGGIKSLGSSAHFFSTRVGGRSEGPYKSLNLGVHTNDNREDVEFNFNRIFESSGMNTERVVHLNQVHGDEFHVVDDDNYQEIINSHGDALITGTPGIAIGVFTADCVPILLQESKRNIIAVVHAGWKGTELNIAKKVLSYIIDSMGGDPRYIYAAIGPSIGPCCFEVNEDVADKFSYKQNIEGKWFVDLWRENFEHIKNCGIPEENIDCSKLCTKCNGELFYSYRRDKGYTGRLGSFIELKQI